MLGRKAGFEGLPTDFSARLALSRHRPNGQPPGNFTKIDIIFFNIVSAPWENPYSEPLESGARAECQYMKPLRDFLMWHPLLLYGAAQRCKFEIVTQKSSVDRERAH